ncbi:MAG: DUF99 family protein, partial [Candidatus Nanohaloarchaea archaeon]|nr:DUF99 family protein [Candidatus Nanohaloarchaea archaeon]
RGNDRLEAVLSRTIQVDGLDATETLQEMLDGTRQQQIQAVLLDGITFGGFNIVDIHALHDASGLPVIAFNRDRPDREQVYDALEHLPDSRQRKELVRKAGRFHEMQLNGRTVHIQIAGTEPTTAEDIITTSTQEATLPEPLRTAHLIGTGISTGESRGT